MLTIDVWSDALDPVLRRTFLESLERTRTESTPFIDALLERGRATKDKEIYQDRLTGKPQLAAIKTILDGKR